MLVGYIGLTPSGPHRTALLIVDVLAILISLFVIGPVGIRSLAARWRNTFFFGWSVGTVLVIAVAVGLDQGADSPLAALLVLPVLFGGLLYPVRDVIGLAVVALTVFALLFVAGPPVGGARALATAIMIGVAGGISAMAAMNREIGEEERQGLTARLHQLATYDGLTGCLNYQAFQAALLGEAERTERYGRQLSVVIADLDGFKAINDRHGHATGDTALTAIAAALQEGVRTADHVGRIGGDEFAVLVPETSMSEARELVQRLQAAVAAVAMPEPLTLSFGLASWTGPGDSPAELLRRADDALYEAKQDGRDRLVVWAPSDRPGSFAGGAGDPEESPPGALSLPG